MDRRGDDYILEGRAAACSLMFVISRFIGLHSVNIHGPICSLGTLAVIAGAYTAPCCHISQGRLNQGTLGTCPGPLDFFFLFERPPTGCGEII